MEDSPRILATFVQSSLEQMDKLDAEIGGRVRAALEPSVLERIEKASPVSWLAVELDVALTECFFQVAGEERATRAFRQALAQSIERPLLQPIVEGALGIFGRDPAKLIRWVPKVWSLIYRDCGEMKFVHSEAGAARLELSELPPCILRSGCYLVGTGATIAAFFDFLGVDARVLLQGPNVAARRAAFDLTW